MTLPLYSSDLDGIEYIFDKDDVATPVALIEKKSTRSSWQEKIPSAMRATIELARRAGLPYYVAVHNEDRSNWTVYEARMHNEVMQILDGTLFDYVMFLCDLHGYTPPDKFIEALQKVRAIDKGGESIEDTGA